MDFPKVFPTPDINVSLSSETMTSLTGPSTSGPNTFRPYPSSCDSQSEMTCEWEGVEIYKGEVGVPRGKVVSSTSSHPSRPVPSIMSEGTYVLDLYLPN